MDLGLLMGLKLSKYGFVGALHLGRLSSPVAQLNPKALIFHHSSNDEDCSVGDGGFKDLTLILLPIFSKVPLLALRPPAAHPKVLVAKEIDLSSIEGCWIPRCCEDRLVLIEV